MLRTLKTKQNVEERTSDISVRKCLQIVQDKGIEIYTRGNLMTLQHSLNITVSEMTIFRIA